jgi:hypothetical protein
VVTISISAAAFASIAATLPKGSKAEARPDGKGAYLVTLDRNVLDRSPIAARAGGELFGCHPAAGGRDASLAGVQAPQGGPRAKSASKLVMAKK